jgi:hypothetical protein
VDADPVVVRDADELERPVLEQRPLDAAAPGIDPDPQEDDLLAHGPTLRSIANSSSSDDHLRKFRQWSPLK